MRADKGGLRDCRMRDCRLDDCSIVQSLNLKPTIIYTTRRERNDEVINSFTHLSGAFIYRRLDEGVTDGVNEGGKHGQ